MIRIALVLTPVDYGGAEKVSYMLLENLKNSEIEYTPIVLIRPWEERNIFVELIEKLGYHYYKVPVALKQRHEGKDYFRVLRCILMMHKIIRKEKFDLIHTNGYFADITCLVASKIQKIKIISTTHGFLWNNWKYKLYNICDLIILRFFSRVITVSNLLKKDLERIGLNRHKVKVIQNAISPIRRRSLKAKQALRAKFGIKSDEIVIGYIGRLSPEKNVDNIIRACHHLVNDQQKIKLLVIGKGPDEMELKNLSSRLGIDDVVHFMGFIRNIDDMIAILDIFVIASKTEGTPMALLEAMSYGVPIIATKVGGIPSIIEDRNNGMLIKPGSPEEIYRAVLEIMNNDKLKTTLEDRSREYIKNKFSLDKWKEEYYRTYCELLEE